MKTSRILEKSGMWLLCAVLIAVVSSALVQRVAMPQPAWLAVAEKQAKFKNAQDSKFQSLVDAGMKALDDRRYPEALSQFQEAERSLAQLNDTQYAALKKARLQIAGAYEAEGNTSGAEGVYKNLADCAFRQDDVALVRYQDAENFSQHLTEQRDSYTLNSTHAQTILLQDMRRFPEALAATQRSIDLLQSTAGEYDARLVAPYSELAHTYQLARDWQRVEETIISTVAFCDKIIAHWAGTTGADNPTSTVLLEKNQLLYALIDAYDQDGKPDLALSTAEDLFNFIAQNSPYAELGPHSRREVANFALRIALKADRQNAADTWRQRS